VKKIDTYKLHTLLTAAYICCYGLAIYGLFSLILLIAPEEYLERNSKLWPSPVKQVLVSNPYLIYYTIVIGSVLGGTIQVLDIKLEKKA
jgi:hypothetical protein